MTALEKLKYQFDDVPGAGQLRQMALKHENC